MPAVAIVVSIAATAAVEEAATFVAWAVLDNVVAAEVVGGAIAGAVGSAAGAAVSGGNVGKAALRGAISGGVGAGFQAATGSLFPETAKGIASSISDSTGLSADVAKKIVSSGERGIGTTLTGLAQGQKPGQAIKSGVASGVGSFLGKTMFDTSSPDLSPGEKLAAQTGQGLLSYETQNLLAPQKSSQTYGGTSAPTQQQAPLQQTSTSALATGLGISADPSYTPGMGMFGSDTDKPKKNVWNISSLKTKDEDTNV